MNISRVRFSSLMSVLLISACAQLPEERPSEKDHSRRPPTETNRSLCVFMDGTANDYDSNTNIRRLYELISARRSPKTICFYDPGVGSNELRLSGMIGGAGFSKNLSQAYDFLRQNYRQGDKIYMFGYSRGARQAQVLCDILDECGLMTASSDTSIAPKNASRVSESRSAIVDYKKYIEKRGKVPTLKRMIETTHWRPVEVEFVGIFDCVEGMANNVLRMMVRGQLKAGDYQDHKYYPYDFPPNIKRAYHAMALDETRGMYQVVKWLRPAEMKRGQVLEQVWFPGGHGDVGGGYAESQSLAGVSLNWMLEKLDPTGLIPAGFRVHEDRDTPSTDTARFGLAGKTLSHLRANSPRSDLFWLDRQSNVSHPSSQHKAFAVMNTKPLVHESVVDRMKRSFPTDGIGMAAVESHGVYRPVQFDMSQPESAFKIYPPEGGARKWPEPPFSCYLGDMTKGLTTVDWGNLEKRIKIVDTKKEK